MVLLFSVGDAGIGVLVGEVGEISGTKPGASDGFAAQLLKTRLYNRTQQRISRIRLLLGCLMAGVTSD